MTLLRNVEPWERAVSIVAGAGLLVLAARRRSLAGVMTPLGIGLIARGGTGYCPVNHAIGRGRALDDTRQALSGSRGMNVVDSITINRPQAEVFEVWDDLANLPRFMPNIERVDVLDDRRSHWVASAPGGMTFEWDAEVLQRIPYDLISWRSLPGSDIATAGSVTFKTLDGMRTRVTVNLQYNAPGGKATAALAALVGQSPSGQTHEGLRRLKSLLEAGEVPTVVGQVHGQRGTLKAPEWVDG